MPSSEELPKDPAEMTDADWQDVLDDDAYHVLREDGTEHAFSGDLYDHDGDGIYLCAGCGAELFDSETKFKSGSGWPSFYEPADEDHVEERKDTGHGMVRTEARCARCDGHLGHVFDDGPEPTGLRYCINSAALTFEGD